MTTTLHIHRWDIENVLRISSQHCDPHGRHVIISGPNGSGKSSSVDAIWFALGGKLPAEPIHRGADKGLSRLELGPKGGPVEYILERHFTPSGTRLSLLNGEGVKVSRPQQLIDSFLGSYALDPIAFLARRPQDQVDDVLAICGVAPPVAQAEHITGERQDARPGESAYAYLARLFADEIGLYYVRRREAHRAVTVKDTALVEQRGIVQRLGGPLKPDEQESSAAGIVKQIEALQQKADERRAVADDAARLRRTHQEGAQSLTRLEQDRAKLVKQIEDLQAQLAGLDARLAQEREYVTDDGAAATAAEEALKLLPDPAPQIRQLRQQLADIEQANEQHSKRRHASEQLERLGQEREALKADHARMEKVVDGGRELRAHLLDGVDLGVSGLEVGDGELRLNGVPFRQASKAQQLHVACVVAMRQRPRLKILRVDDGEHLDSQMRELLLTLAEQHGWQVIMTTVADHEGLRVAIVDGQPEAPGVSDLFAESRA